MKRRTLGTLTVVVVLVAACGSDEPADVEREDLPTAASGVCGGEPATTVEAVIAAGPSADAELAIEGRPGASVACTQKGCSALDECCNACGGSYFLGDRNDVRAQMALVHAEFSCGGDECNTRCSPLSANPTRRYRFVGTVTWSGTPARPSMNVRAFCRVT